VISLLLLTIAAAQLADGGVVFPVAISKQYQSYSKCLFDGAMPDNMMPSDRSMYRRNVEAAIVTCATVRQAMMVEAERILSATREYADPAVRSAAITRTFDGAVEQQRKLPEIMDKVRRERLGW
jgi:hypothetical protein